MKKYFLPLGVLGIFMTIAVTLWLTQDNIFYLFNFSYIGISIFFGIFLYIKKYKYARRVAQLLVGLYMLVYLGFICGENMQIEGFWYYLFTGVFEAATIHYAVAKIFGPLLFGRGWCGYACWTAMVLDFLPYKVPKTPRKKIGWIRYITFAISLIFVSVLFLAHIGNIERIMFWAFIIGNAIYYIVGIILAFVFKDNRAFMLPFSMLAICFVETWQRSASCSWVKPASLRSLRTFSPSTFKSEFGIIVHLNSIVSFW